MRLSDCSQNTTERSPKVPERRRVPPDSPIVHVLTIHRFHDHALAHVLEVAPQRCWQAVHIDENIANVIVRKVEGLEALWQRCQVQSPGYEVVRAVDLVEPFWKGSQLKSPLNPTAAHAPRQEDRRESLRYNFALNTLAKEVDVVDSRRNPLVRGNERVARRYVVGLPVDSCDEERLALDALPPARVGSGGGLHEKVPQVVFGVVVVGFDAQEAEHGNSLVFDLFIVSSGKVSCEDKA